MNIINIESVNVGMKYDMRAPHNGFFGKRNSTIHRSAAQKYVRRCEYKKAIYAGMNNWLLNGSIRTNIWNRVLIMCFEDIGPANFGLWVSVYKSMMNRKNNKYSSRLDELKDFVKYVYILSKSPKSRVWDNMCSIRYFHYKDKKNPINYKVNMDIEKIIKEYIEAFKKKELIKIIIITDYLYYNIKGCDKKLMKKYDLVKSRARSSLEYITGTLLKIRNDDVMKGIVDCIKYYKNESCRLPIMGGIWYALNLPTCKVNVDKCDDEKIIKWVLSNPDIKYDQYVYDRHVGKMKGEELEFKPNKTYKFFFEEGAKLIGEKDDIIKKYSDIIYDGFIDIFKDK